MNSSNFKRSRQDSPSSQNSEGQKTKIPRIAAPSPLSKAVPGKRAVGTSSSRGALRSVPPNTQSSSSPHQFSTTQKNGGLPAGSRLRTGPSSQAFTTSTRGNTRTPFAARSHPTSGVPSSARSSGVREGTRSTTGSPRVSQQSPRQRQMDEPSRVLLAQMDLLRRREQSNNVLLEELDQRLEASLDAVEAAVSSHDQHLKRIAQETIQAQHAHRQAMATLSIGWQRFQAKRKGYQDEERDAAHRIGQLRSEKEVMAQLLELETTNIERMQESLLLCQEETEAARRKAQEAEAETHLMEDDSYGLTGEVKELVLAKRQVEREMQVVQEKLMQAEVTRRELYSTCEALNGCIRVYGRVRGTAPPASLMEEGGVVEEEESISGMSSARPSKQLLSGSPSEAGGRSPFPTTTTSYPPGGMDEPELENHVSQAEEEEEISFVVNGEEEEKLEQGGREEMHGVHLVNGGRAHHSGGTMEEPVLAAEIPSLSPNVAVSSLRASDASSSISQSIAGAAEDTNEGEQLRCRANTVDASLALAGGSKSGVEIFSASSSTGMASTRSARSNIGGGGGAAGGLSRSTPMRHASSNAKMLSLTSSSSSSSLLSSSVHRRPPPSSSSRMQGLQREGRRALPSSLAMKRTSSDPPRLHGGLRKEKVSPRESVAVGTLQGRRGVMHAGMRNVVESVPSVQEDLEEGELFSYGPCPRDAELAREMMKSQQESNGAAPDTGVRGSESRSSTSGTERGTASHRSSAVGVDAIPVRTITVHQRRQNATSTGSNETTESFTFDRVFSEQTTQETVYKEVEPLILNAVDGFSICIFAYGQTGSGKTFSMEGNLSNPALYGIIPRAMHTVFDRQKTLEKEGWRYEFRCSVIEIYNDSIRDLLQPTALYECGGAAYQQPSYHTIQHHSEDHSTTVTRLREQKIQHYDDFKKVYQQAVRHRRTAATILNARSSRSHCIFLLHLDGVNDVIRQRSQGKLCLVDLAGSERVNDSGVKGQQLKEAININKSLLDLGKCISALRTSALAPWRNSKLTYLLQNYLGAKGGKMLMLVTVSDKREHVSETVNALRFAARVSETVVGPSVKRMVKY